jgi:hypothetical protein
MNLEPENPEIPKHTPQKPAGRSFDQLVKQLSPQLEKLPPDQRLPQLPPSEEVLAEVVEYVKSLGLTVPPVPPPVAGIGGEFLDPLKLREGRIGLHRNHRVAAFLHRYEDKTLRAIVLYPRDGVDIRKIALAVIWGQLGDVPESLVQTEVVSVADFFAICAYDVSKLIDVPALELYKRSFRLEVEAEISSLRDRITNGARAIERLERDKSAGEKLLAEAREDAVGQNDRAEFWRVVALFSLGALIPAGIGIARVWF